jgi:hypothetical protein
MSLRSTIRHFLLAMTLCLLAMPLFAQSSPRESGMPLQLTLQSSSSSTAGIYQDSSGRIYNVTPQDAGGALCDQAGCVVHVCNGTTCTYYRCTTQNCTRVNLPAPGAGLNQTKNILDSIS